MTKAELIDELAKATGLTKQESAGIVETVFECITAALVKGTKVELRGFGSFKVRQHSFSDRTEPKGRDRCLRAREESPAVQDQ